MIFRYPGGKDRLARKVLKDTTIRYADTSDNEVSVTRLTQIYAELEILMGTIGDLMRDFKAEQAGVCPAFDEPATPKSDQERAA